MMIERLIGGACLMLGATAAQAQVPPETIPSVGNFGPPAVQPAPTPTPTASPIARAPVVVSPTPVPSAGPSTTPTARATPAPRPSTSSRSASKSAPTPRASPASAPNPAASPSATVAAAPAEVLPTPRATATPAPATPTVAAAPAGTTGALPWWAIPAVLLGLVALGAAIVAWRKRRPVKDRLPDPIRVAPPPLAPPAAALAEPAPPPATPASSPPRFLDPAPATRAWIDLETPHVARAGVNLVTATADVTIVVRNDSPAYATGVTLDIRLTSAQPGQDEALAELFAAPIARPAAPPFDLAAGETKRIRALATLPRAAITVLTAGERPMFVPVVAIRADYGAGEGMAGQTTAAYALGIERPGQAKLAPFWLDQPPRMFDAIGIRAHAAVGKK